ncbi:MAG: hypothetical protein C4518_06360 [Desulfobacteraceae bacterium]|nr:MAG: hypothetical protein C4518_06360 [Desulfobacteraceae bacterium]
MAAKDKSRPFPPDTFRRRRLIGFGVFDEARAMDAGFVAEHVGPRNVAVCRLGHGGFCRDSKTCTFPKCGFGK